MRNVVEKESYSKNWNDIIIGPNHQVSQNAQWGMWAFFARFTPLWRGDQGKQFGTFYTVDTLSNTGWSEFMMRLLPSEAEVLWGASTEPKSLQLKVDDLGLYPLILADAEGDFLIFSEFLLWMMLSCFFRRSFAWSKCFFLSSLFQYRPICKHSKKKG